MPKKICKIHLLKSKQKNKKFGISEKYVLKNIYILENKQNYILILALLCSN